MGESAPRFLTNKFLTRQGACNKGTLRKPPREGDAVATMELKGLLEGRTYQVHCVAVDEQQNIMESRYRPGSF